MGEVREHSVEFRVDIAKRMLAGESAKALSREYGLARSMMYRWRDTYRKQGAIGLERPPGRPPGKAGPASAAAKRDDATEQQLRQCIAELERKVGRQAIEIDFFKGVFKRLEELPKAKRRGGDASTRRSDA
jgi:transposase